MVERQWHEAHSRRGLSSINQQAIPQQSAERAQTQGKIERWHQTLKNRILLENYFLPGDLEAKIQTFVDHYNL